MSVESVKVRTVSVTFRCDAEGCDERMISKQYPSLFWAERLLPESGWRLSGKHHFCREHSEEATDDPH